MKKPFALAGIALAFLFLLQACSSTRIVETWKDANLGKGPAEKLLVISTVKSWGPRSLVEEAFGKELRSRGVLAVASTSVFPEGAIPPRDVVAAKVKELGSDAVLVVRFVKKDTGETHTPGRLYKGQPDFDETWEDASVSSPDTSTPDVSYEYTVVVMKTLLYRTGSDKPVWSALTETKYQNNPFKQVEPFAAIIVRRLARDRMIP